MRNDITNTDRVWSKHPKATSHSHRTKQFLLNRLLLLLLVVMPDCLTIQFVETDVFFD